MGLRNGPAASQFEDSLDSPYTCTVGTQPVSHRFDHKVTPADLKNQFAPSGPDRRTDTVIDKKSRSGDRGVSNSAAELPPHSARRAGRSTISCAVQCQHPDGVMSGYFDPKAAFILISRDPPLQPSLTSGRGEQICRAKSFAQRKGECPFADQQHVLCPLPDPPPARIRHAARLASTPCSQVETTMG